MTTTRVSLDISDLGSIQEAAEEIVEKIREVFAIHSLDLRLAYDENVRVRIVSGMSTPVRIEIEVPA